MRVDSTDSLKRVVQKETIHRESPITSLQSVARARALPLPRPAMDVTPAKYAFIIILLHFQHTETLYITDTIGMSKAFPLVYSAFTIDVYFMSGVP